MPKRGIAGLPDAATPGPPAPPIVALPGHAIAVAVGRPVAPSAVPAGAAITDFSALVSRSFALSAAPAGQVGACRSAVAASAAPAAPAEPGRAARRGKDEAAAEPVALPIAIAAPPATPPVAALPAPGLLAATAETVRRSPAATAGHAAAAAPAEAPPGPPRTAQAAADAPAAARCDPAAPVQTALPSLPGAPVFVAAGAGGAAAPGAAAHGPTTPAAQIAHGIGELSAAIGTNRVVVQLTPTELGRVTISIVRDPAGGSAVNVTAERAETLALVRAEVSQLHAALDQAGIGAHGRSLAFQLAEPASGGPVVADAGPRAGAHAVAAAPGAQHAGTEGGGAPPSGGQPGLGAQDRQPAPHQGRPAPGPWLAGADDTAAPDAAIAPPLPWRGMLRAVDFTA